MKEIDHPKITSGVAVLVARTTPASDTRNAYQRGRGAKVAEEQKWRT